MPEPYHCPKDGGLHERYERNGKTYCAKCGAILYFTPRVPETNRESKSPSDKEEE